MPRAGKKKPNDPLLDIQNAISRKMHRPQTPHAFICKHDLDQVWADHPLRNLFPNFSPEEFEAIRKNYIRVLSILVCVDWTDLKSRFRPVFLREAGRDDEHLPFADLAFLGTSSQIFASYQHAFTPVVIQEHSEKFIQDIPTEHRLPFIDEPEDVRLGGYGSVTKRTIAPRCLRNQEDNKENPEPKLVACKTYRNENPLQDFKQEVRNLDYIKESLTDSERVMKHIAAIVHGNEIMIILPHADLYDLEIFLRGGYEPDPSTDDSRKIYDFKTIFPIFDTSVNWQRTLIEEAHHLASALKWLHEDLKIFGSFDRYLAHMDLKPANVLLVGDSRSPAGKWMLSDFGVSSFHKATNKRAPDTPSIRDVGYRLTSRGFQHTIVRGHGPYQPPEVDLQNVDSRKCDVWSFAGILCDILAFLIGKAAAVKDLRSSRYVAGDDYFYKTVTLTGKTIRAIDDSNTELKPQIDRWWEKLERSSVTWVVDYIRVLRDALRPKPSDRSNIRDIVYGLNALAPLINSQENGNITPESKVPSSKPQTNPHPSQKGTPLITILPEPSPSHYKTMDNQDTASKAGNNDQSLSKLLPPGPALQPGHALPAKHEEDNSQNSSSTGDLSISAPNLLITRSPSPPDELCPNVHARSVSILGFEEEPKISVPLPKRDKVKAVSITPSPLQVAVLCKHSVHFYSKIDGQGKKRKIDLSPKVDWKKIRLASQYFAVYGLKLPHEKRVEILNLETLSPDTTITDNGELQDILLSEEKVFAYVYRKSVKLHFARLNVDRIVPFTEDDAVIVQAKFSASGKILCVWATGTGADHAYFVRVNEELASASRCGEGSYHKPITTLRTCDIWPFPDSPACVIHEADGGTFIAQPSNQRPVEPQHRESIGIPNVLTACVVREDLLVCINSRTLRSERLMRGFALSQEPGDQRRIAGLSRDFGLADKDIEKSTAIAVHLVDGKSELVLCTTTGKVLGFLES